MGKIYSPRTFFRRCCNNDLKQYFHDKNLLLDFDFDGMSQTKIVPLYERWLELPDEARNRTDLDFQDVHHLSCESGIKAILTESIWPEHRKTYPDDNDLGARLGNMEDHSERVFWIFRNRQNYWQGALFCHKIDQIRDSVWHKIKNLPKINHHPDDHQTNELEQDIGSYFHRKDGKGKNCKVEVYRWEGDDCYFCYPEDYATASIEYENSEFIRRPHNPAFEVIFRHNLTNGTLETKAKGGKNVVADLQKLFAQNILSIDDLSTDSTSERVYNMEWFKSPYFRFGPESGIIDIVIKKMVFSPHDGSKDTIAITSGLNNGRHSIQKTVQNCLNGLSSANNGKRISYFINRVDIQVKFTMPNGKRPKTKTFYIAYPNRSNLQHDKWDLIIKQMLKQSGIEPVDPGTLIDTAKFA